MLDTSEINIMPMPGSELRLLGFPARGFFAIPTELFWFLQTFHAKGKNVEIFCLISLLSYRWLSLQPKHLFQIVT